MSLVALLVYWLYPVAPPRHDRPDADRHAGHRQHARRPPCARGAGQPLRGHAEPARRVVAVVRRRGRLFAAIAVAPAGLAVSAVDDLRHHLHGQSLPARRLCRRRARRRPPAVAGPALQILSFRTTPCGQPAGRRAGPRASWPGSRRRRAPPASGRAVAGRRALVPDPDRQPGGMRPADQARRDDGDELAAQLVPVRQLQHLEAGRHRLAEEEVRDCGLAGGAGDGRGELLELRRSACRRRTRRWCGLRGGTCG